MNYLRIVPYPFCRWISFGNIDSITTYTQFCHILEQLNRELETELDGKVHSNSQSRDNISWSASNYHQESTIESWKPCPHAGGEPNWASHSMPEYGSCRHIVKHFIKQTLANCGIWATSIQLNFCRQSFIGTNSHAFVSILPSAISHTKGRAE